MSVYNNPDFRHFLNRVKYLYFIESHELSDVLSVEQRRQFLHDPPKFLFRVEDHVVAAIWKIVERQYPYKLLLEQMQ